MQRVRATILLLHTLLIAVTSIGMEMMPISMPVAEVHRGAAVHASLQGDSQPDEEPPHGSDDCFYCQLAKATELPSLDGVVAVRLRLLPRVVGMQTASCDLQTWTLPCWPRAPPASVAS